jgi:hypothetical protein
MGRLSPADFRTVYGFRRPDVTLLGAHARFCGLDYPFTIPEAPELRCCPSSLYTFPAGISPGLARDCHLRFPEFEQFCIAGFPDEHSSFP